MDGDLPNHMVTLGRSPKSEILDFWDLPPNLPYISPIGESTVHLPLHFLYKSQMLWKKKIFIVGALGLLKACVCYFFIKILFFHQMIVRQKLWKIFFISKKLFSLLRCSIFCNFFSSFPQFPDSKGQMEVE